MGEIERERERERERAEYTFIIRCEVDLMSQCFFVFSLEIKLYYVPLFKNVKDGLVT